MGGICYWVQGSAEEVLAAIAERAPGSIDCLVTSPPYLAKRAYLPADHPRKDEEYGTELTPGEFVGGQLRWLDLAYEAIADHGTAFINYGDTAAGSGGAGGDYQDGGLREGQPTYRARRETTPKIRAGTARPDRPGVRTKDSVPADQLPTPTTYGDPKVDGREKSAELSTATRRRTAEESRAGVDAKNRGNSSTGTAAKARAATKTDGRVKGRAAKYGDGPDAKRARSGSQRAAERAARDNHGLEPERMRTRRTLPGWPRDKSVCWVPPLIGASMAYGHNLLDPPRIEGDQTWSPADLANITDYREAGQTCQQWVTRPPITWCSPNPTPGSITDKFREATELIIFAAKKGRYWFDLHALRHQPKRGRPHDQATSTGFTGHPAHEEGQGKPDRVSNVAGAPPLNWWVIANPGYKGAHYATFCTELVYQPILGGCPQAVCKLCGTPRTRIVDLEADPGNRATNGQKRSEGQQLGNYDERADTESLHLGWTECGCGDGCRATVIRYENRVRVIDDLGECADPSHWRAGRVIDPFGGSGTVGEVASALGRDAILIDLDERNVELAAGRLGFTMVEVTVDELIDALRPPADPEEDPNG